VGAGRWRAWIGSIPIARTGGDDMKYEQARERAQHDVDAIVLEGDTWIVMLHNASPNRHARRLEARKVRRARKVRS
jgi:hypothetical protein